MQLKSLVLTLLLAVLTMHAFAQKNSDYQAYVDKYKKLAVKEMNRAGIPASIKVAQALLESGAGNSELARKANNHFGVKCHSDWTGKTYELEDDEYDDFGNIKKSCFRKYKNVEDSYIAHSEFLRDPRKANRYGFLFRLDITDYKRWARGLKTAGYATAGNYDNQLIKIIETYELYQYDQLSDDNFPDGRPDKPKDLIAGLDVRRVNDVRVVFAKNNVTVEEISQKAGITISRLEKYNEKLPEVNAPLPDDTRIYIQPKRCGVRGGKKWHYVKAGESIFDISQFYGIKSKRLRKRNRIPDAAEVQINERIKLRGFRIGKAYKPRLATESMPTGTVPPLLDPDDDFMDDDTSITPEPSNPGTVTPTTPSTDPAQPADGNYHTVVKGDTLYNISRRYGLTVNQLMEINGLLDNNIKIGQKLKVK
ncbi:MAG: LysM peptidoglycan-binding domain-containing protein [Saprospiraceae bacterium]|nr:LysM peptidoglycan-binding domain-containing protein [Saprospiraceae bacterium]